MKFHIEQLRSLLNEDTAILITSAPSRFYFSGFRSSDGIILITLKSAVLFIDFRYFEKAKNTINHIDVVLANNTYDQIKKILSQESIKKVYVENDNLNYNEHKRISSRLGLELSDDNVLCEKIRNLRSIKSEREISYIKEAQRFTDETFSYIVQRIREGVSEREIMLDMEFYMRRLGSEGISFDFIVVSGKNSSLPHGVPTDKLIEKGDFITMDFGAVYNGYRSDMTRTVAVGMVSDEQRTVYNTVLEAQDAALRAIKPGIICREIDKISRDIIYDKGYEGCFGHGLGHSVGLQVHEYPSFNTRCEEILKPGMIMTVEPGIYLEGKFGVRIEDMVVVTDNGHENLTHSRKDLIIL